MDADATYRGAVRRWWRTAVFVALAVCGLAITPEAGAASLTADEQLRFADGIYLRGFHSAAVGEYLALLRDFPDSPHTAAALYRTGECYRQMGNASGAERFYKQLETRFPDSPQAMRAALRRAEMALAEDRFEDAAFQTDALLQRKPPEETAAAAAYYLGFSRWKLGDRKGAETAYEEVLNAHGTSPYASYAALDLTTMNAGLKKAEGNMVRWFERAVETAATPSAKAEAMFRWGDWAFRKGDYEEAAGLLQSLLVELPGETRARDARLALGWSLYYLDRASEALELAEEAETRAGDAESGASGAYLYANCLRKMNRDGEALEVYMRVTRDYPSSRFANRAAYEIMATHFKRGDWTKTLAAAPAQPAAENAADVLWMRSEAERQSGSIDAARGHYEELAREYPDAPQAPSALMRLGEMARDASRWSEAASWFGRVAETYPKDDVAPEALKAAALARLRAGDAKGALAGWDDLLAAKPDADAAAAARLQKALTLVELKRNSAALKELNALLEDGAGEQTARAQYWRGFLLAVSEKWSDAESAFRACLASAPDLKTAALARLQLAVALQRQDRMDEAADQVEPLLADPQCVADNPALVDWLVRRRFEQGQITRALQAAMELALNGREASWRQIAWFWAGACRAEQDDEKAAAAAYEKSLAEDARTREGTEARLLLAAMELKAENTPRAATLYAAAAETAGDDALDLRVRALFGLGETAEAAGNDVDAARHYMSVAVLFDDPEWTPHALFRAGEVYGRLGKSAEKSAAWKELAERWPESAFARRTEAAAP